MGVIQTRVDDKTRTAAEKVFNSMGMTLSDGVRLFIKQTMLRKKIPFEVLAEDNAWLAHENSSHIPNEETARAIKDLDAGKSVKTFHRIEDFIADLKA